MFLSLLFSECISNGHEHHRTFFRQCHYEQWMYDQLHSVDSLTRQLVLIILNRNGENDPMYSSSVSYACPSCVVHKHEWGFSVVLCITWTITKALGRWISVCCSPGLYTYLGDPELSIKNVGDFFLCSWNNVNWTSPHRTSHRPCQWKEALFLGIRPLVVERAFCSWKTDSGVHILFSHK